MDLKSISFFVITYNQEDVISRTLDSILKQKEWGVKYIFIGDDCSQDKTWDIIKEYYKRYPEIIVPQRNEHNLGIYKNILKLVESRKRSDLYTHIAGDDGICEGFLEAVQGFISENKIDTEQSVGIYGDYKKIRGNNEFVCKNNMILGDYSPLSLYIRRKISTRSLLFSEAVIQKCEPIILDRGLNLAESMYDFRYMHNIDKAYYLPYVGTVYNMGIGVSSTMDMLSYRTEQSLIKWQYFYEHYAESSKDKAYLQFCIEECHYRLNPTFRRLVKMLNYYKKGKLSSDVASIKEFIGKFYSFLRYYFSYMKKKK